MSSDTPPFRRLSQKLIAALKKGKEATPLLNPQENYNEAIIGVYSAPKGGVAVYDIDYLIDATFRSYKEEIQDSLKLNEEELREDAEKHITSYALRVAKGMYGVRGPIIVRKARDIEEDVTKDYLAVKGQRYSVLESGKHFKKKDREGEEGEEEDNNKGTRGTLQKPIKNKFGIYLGTCIPDKEEDDDKTQEKPKQPAKKKSKASLRHLSVPLAQANLSFMTEHQINTIKNSTSMEYHPFPGEERDKTTPKKKADKKGRKST